MPRHRSAEPPSERDAESAAAFGWLSLAGIVLFTVLMAVHVVGRTGVWSTDPAPAHWAQPADQSGRSPSSASNSGCRLGPDRRYSTL